jgi:hypothetical protein
LGAIKLNNQWVCLMFFLRFFLGGVVFAVGFLYAFYFITHTLNDFGYPM